jgi:hypothetical protein
LKRPIKRHNFFSTISKHSQRGYCHTQKKAETRRFQPLSIDIKIAQSVTFLFLGKLPTGLGLIEFNQSSF